MSQQTKPKPQPQPKEMTFQEYYTNMRGNIIVSYDGAKELALKALDDLAGKFADSMKQVETLQGALKVSAEAENKKADAKAEKKPKKD